MGTRTSSKFVFNDRELAGALLRVTAYGLTAFVVLWAIVGILWRSPFDESGPLVSLLPFVAVLWFGIYYLNRRWPGGLLVPIACWLVGLLPVVFYVVHRYF